jgi:hypothetical protein
MTILRGLLVMRAGGRELTTGTRVPGFATQLSHTGENGADHLGVVCLPILQSSIFDERWPQSEPLGYMRLGNGPNHDVLGTELAAREEPR